MHTRLLIPAVTLLAFAQPAIAQSDYIIRGEGKTLTIRDSGGVFYTQTGSYPLSVFVNPDIYPWYIGCAGYSPNGPPGPSTVGCWYVYDDFGPDFSLFIVNIQGWDPMAGVFAAYPVGLTHSRARKTVGPDWFEFEVWLRPEFNADFNCDGVTNGQDIFDFLAAWFAGLPSSDANADGLIGVGDVFFFLREWFNG